MTSRPLRSLGAAGVVLALAATALPAAAAAQVPAGVAPPSAALLVPVPDARLLPLPADVASPATADGEAWRRASGRPLFSRQDLAYWGTVAAAGVALYQLDGRIARAAPDSVLREDGGLDYASIRLSSFNEYAAAYVALGIYGSGRLLGKREFAEMGLHAVEAALLGKVAMDLGRGFAGRARPITHQREGRPFDRGDFEWWRGFEETGYGAMPSRHTTGVAAVMSTIAFETRHHFPQHSKWVTPLAIAVPLAVGAGRVYSNHHWATDVLVGGALGTWLGWKTVRFNHNRPDNAVDRLLLGRRDR